MRCLSLALGVSFLIAASSFASTIAIDDLTQGPMSYSATGSGATNGANQSGINTLGGARGSELEHLFDSGMSSVSLSAGGPLTFSGANNFFELGYGYSYTGANGIQISSSLGANLTGTNGIEIDFAPGSSAGIQLFMSSGATGAKESDDNGHGVGLPGGGTSVFIPYSSLSPTFGGGVDLAQVDHILITFQNQGSLTITKIAAIPEPTTMLLPLALFTFATGRRRRAKL